jgi:hypothetical protein
LRNLLCGDAHNGKYYGKYVHNVAGHGISRWDFHVRFETLHKIAYALEDLDEQILARIYVFSRLRNPSVMIPSIHRLRMMLTLRRMPIPEKTICAGENI